MAVLFIFCSVDQRNYAAPRVFHQALNGLGVAAEFLKVTILEFDPFQWIMIKPLPEDRAGRYIFEPQVDMCRALGYSARPESIDQNPEAVTRLGLFVCAFQKNSHREYPT